ncbi:hypothetical protein Ancab_014163, partial [Ancistrocladus abbreviatus]
MTPLYCHALLSLVQLQRMLLAELWNRILMWLAHCRFCKKLEDLRWIGRKWKGRRAVPSFKKAVSVAVIYAMAVCLFGSRGRDSVQRSIE